MISPIARNRLLCARQECWPLTVRISGERFPISGFVALSWGREATLGCFGISFCVIGVVEKCQVSREGVLFSANLRLEALLQPISRLQAQVSALPVPSLPPMAPAAKNLVCKTAG